MLYFMHKAFLGKFLRFTLRWKLLKNILRLTGCYSDCSHHVQTSGHRIEIWTNNSAVTVGLDGNWCCSNEISFPDKKPGFNPRMRQNTCTNRELLWVEFNIDQMDWGQVQCCAFCTLLSGKCETSVDNFSLEFCNPLYCTIFQPSWTNSRYMIRMCPFDQLMWTFYLLCVYVYRIDVFRMPVEFHRKIVQEYQFSSLLRIRREYDRFDDIDYFVWLFNYSAHDNLYYLI